MSSTRVLVGLLEIVGAVEEAVAPVEAQPVDVLLDGVHKLGVLLGGVGVVHAQVADAAELFGGAEVDAQRLAVADVQIAVRLRREAGVHLHALKLPPGPMSSSTKEKSVFVEKSRSRKNLHPVGAIPGKSITFHKFYPALPGVEQIQHLQQGIGGQVLRQLQRTFPAPGGGRRCPLRR
jgi:hypothetical protein